MHCLRLLSFIIIFCCTSVYSPFLCAQWQPTNGPFHNNVYSFLTTGSIVLVGTDTGIYLSEDNGQHWVPTTGMPAIPYMFTFTNFCTDGSAIYAGTYRSGVFVSHDRGYTWSSTATFLSGADFVTGVAVQRKRLFITTGFSGLQVSDDGGTTWTKAGEGQIPDQSLSIASDGTNLLVVTRSQNPLLNSLMRSADNGATWLPVDLGGDQPMTVSIADSIFFATIEGGLYRSTDGGVTWSKSTVGIPPHAMAEFIISHEGQLFAAMNYGVGYYAIIYGFGSAGIYTSTDSGSTWSLYREHYRRVDGLGVLDAKIAAGIWADGLYVFDENKLDSTLLYKGLVSTSTITGLHANAGSVYSITYNDKMLHSMSAGESEWETVGIISKMPAKTPIAITTCQNRFIVGMQNDDSIPSPTILLSDDGRHWYSPDVDIENQTIFCLAANDHTIVAGGYSSWADSSTASYSIDGGVTWHKSGLLSEVSKFAVDNNVFFAACVDGIFRSEDGQHWTVTGIEFPFQTYTSAISATGSTIYFSFSNESGEEIAISRDNGATWSFSTQGLPLSNVMIYDILVYDQYVFAAGMVDSKSAIFLSSDSGRLWTDVTGSLKGSRITSLAVNNNYLYAGTISAAVWRRSLSELVPTAIGEQQPELQQYVLQPHPLTSTSVLHLCSSCNLHNAVLTLSTVDGRVVYTRGGVCGTDIPIPRGDLATGVYGFSITEGGRVVTAGTLVVR